MQKPKYLKLPNADRLSAGGFEKLIIWRTCLYNKINYGPHCEVLPNMPFLLPDYWGFQLNRQLSSVHEVWSSILGGVNKIFFFLFILPIKILWVFKACRRHKKVLTFSKIGCQCYEFFSHVFTPSEIFFNIPRVG